MRAAFCWKDQLALSPDWSCRCSDPSTVHSLNSSGSIMEQESCKLERYVLAWHHIPTQKWPIQQLIVFCWWDCPPRYRVTVTCRNKICSTLLSFSKNTAFLVRFCLILIGRKLQTLFHSKTFQTKAVSCSFGCSVACICQGLLVFLGVMVLLPASHTLKPPYASNGGYVLGCKSLLSGESRCEKKRRSIFWTCW